MFRAPQILTWSCSTRPVLLSRVSHLSVVSERSGAVCHRARHVKERLPGRDRENESSPLSKETASHSGQSFSYKRNCDDCRLIEASVHKALSKGILSSHHHTPQFSTSVKAKLSSDPLKDSQNVNTHQDCLTKTTRLQAPRRFSDYCHFLPSFPSKFHFNAQRHLFHISNLLVTQTLNHGCSRPQATGHFLHQNRGIHQASLRLVDDWKDCLSPENENRCRLNLSSNLELYDSSGSSKAASQNLGEKQRKYAAVLVSLCTIEGEPACLFTLRSTKLGRNKGDVSFAGGKSDPSDRDVVATALRETREELGVDVATERVWGVLKPLRDMTGMMIAPVLANLGPIEELSFKPNPAEVEDIFTLPLSHLCNPQNCGYTHFRTGNKYGYTLPVFHNNKKRIWGLTAIVLDHTLKLIVPS